MSALTVVESVAEVLPRVREAGAVGERVHAGPVGRLLLVIVIFAAARNKAAPADQRERIVNETEIRKEIIAVRPKPG
jgi:hypothetical protein